MLLGWTRILWFGFGGEAAYVSLWCYCDFVGRRFGSELHLRWPCVLTILNPIYNWGDASDF